jgi:hypothetical protein
VVVLRRGWTLMVVAMIMMVAVVAGARKGPEGHEEVGARSWWGLATKKLVGTLPGDGTAEHPGHWH